MWNFTPKKNQSDEAIGAGRSIVPNFPPRSNGNPAFGPLNPKIQARNRTKFGRNRASMVKNEE
jgi:hypothetical protein